MTICQHLPVFNHHFARGVCGNVRLPVTRFKGDLLPVSKMPLDGAVPTATARLEKRGIATECPRWLPENCIQCNQCNFVCPHATIRAKQIAPGDLAGAPEGFVTLKSNTKNDRGLLYREQCYIEDCVGCGSCAQVCPAKTKALVMTPIAELRAAGEAQKAEFFDRLPDNVLDGIKADTLKGSQFVRPLFEFSGACAGCGETPYVKLATQICGDRMIIANATGCSSIYGGTFPTCPYAVTTEGKGPAWANSLFEGQRRVGGPAGSSFARVAAGAGLDVLVVGKRKEIGVPVRCGEGLGSLEILKQGFELPRACYSIEIEGAKIYAPNGKSITWKGKDTSGWVLERKVFDKWLSELAVEKGAKVHTYTRAVGVIRDEKGKPKGVRLSHGGKEPYEATAPLIVSAEGMESLIARELGFKTVHSLYDVDTCYEYEMQP